MPRRETLQIARAAPGKMRTGDPEMVEKFAEAGLDRAVLLGFADGCYGRSSAFYPMVLSIMWRTAR
jgi:hypothetical protein